MNDKSMGKLEAWREVMVWAAVQDRRYCAHNYAGSVQRVLSDLVAEMEAKIVAEVKKP